MKISLRTRSILTVFTLSILGCDPDEPKPEPVTKHEETSGPRLGKPSPEPPVMPSPTPSIPASANPEPKAEPPK